MLRRILALFALLACLPAQGWSAQVGSDEFSWEGASSGGGVTESNWFSGECNSPNCNGGAGGCGSTGCSDPPCGGPLYQQKYISVFGGFADIDSVERTITDASTEYVDRFGLHDGFAGGFAVGGQMIEYVRSEFEVTYRDNDFSSYTQEEFDFSGLLLDSDRVDATGGLRTYSGMFNLLFDTCPRCPGSPALYFGGGLGAIYADGSAETATEDFSVEDSSFAWQGIVGINYPLRRQLDLYTEYRFLGAEKLNVENLTSGDSLGDFSYHAHNLFLGLRLRR